MNREELTVYDRLQAHLDSFPVGYPKSQGGGGTSDLKATFFRIGSANSPRSFIFAKIYGQHISQMPSPCGIGW